MRRRPRGCSASSPTAPATARWPRTCWPTPSSARCARGGASTAAAARRRPGSTRSRSTSCATTPAAPPRKARAPARHRRRRDRRAKPGGRRAPRRAPARAGRAEPGGARGDRAALRRRADRARDGGGARGAADHGRGPRLPGAAQAARRAQLGFDADRARRGISGALHPQSALAGLNPLSRGSGPRGQRAVSGVDGRVPRDVAREPGQVRKEAALSGHRQAQRECPTGAGERRTRPGNQPRGRVHGPLSWPHSARRRPRTRSAPPAGSRRAPWR